jgi:hypothetical protein
VCVCVCVCVTIYINICIYMYIFMYVYLPERRLIVQGEGGGGGSLLATWQVALIENRQREPTMLLTVALQCCLTLENTFYIECVLSLCPLATFIVIYIYIYICTYTWLYMYMFSFKLYRMCSLGYDDREVPQGTNSM